MALWKIEKHSVALAKHHNRFCPKSRSSLCIRYNQQRPASGRCAWIYGRLFGSNRWRRASLINQCSPLPDGWRNWYYWACVLRNRVDSILLCLLLLYFANAGNSSQSLWENHVMIKIRRSYHQTSTPSRLSLYFGRIEWTSRASFPASPCKTIAAMSSSLSAWMAARPCWMVSKVPERCLSKPVWNAKQHCLSPPRFT